MKFKRIISAFLCFALLFCGAVFAAGGGGLGGGSGNTGSGGSQSSEETNPSAGAISINQPVVEGGKVTVAGKAEAPEGTYMVLRVAKAGIDIDSAAPNDYIYLGETQVDAEGNYLFTFPIGDYTGTFELAVTCNSIDGEETSQFTFIPNGDSSIKSFQLSGKNCTISGNSITGPSFSNVSGLIATFTLAEGATAYVNGVKQISGTTRNNFTNPVTYTIVADNGSQSEYVVTVTKENAGGGTGTGTGTGGTGSNTGGGSFTTPGKNDPVTPSEEMGSFSDVPSTHWAYDAVEKMAASDTVKGYEDGSFHPDANITREEFVKILVNYFDFTPEETTVSFSDVSESEWYAYYIQIAVANGIVRGVSADRFGVGENITRQDMAVMLDRAMSAKGITLSEKNEKMDFSDGSSISAYAAAAVELLQKAGVINGYEDATFRPFDNATRAEACSMLAKID